MTPPRLIVVGMDGSAPSRRALAWATELAGTLGAEVVVGHALGLLELRPAGSGHATEADRRAAAVTRLDEWCGPLRAAGVPHRVRVVDGSPAPALLALAAEVRADLIVVGPRGEDAHRELGSTSHELVARSPVPVVVVPETH